MRVVRSGFCHIHIGPVRPGLVFFSDLQKSWGESVTGRIIALAALQGRVHSILCTRILIWSRALAIARAVS